MVDVITTIINQHDSIMLIDHTQALGKVVSGKR
jgi:hypothetical protein